MKKINWKVRLKQPAFWIATIPVVISFVYAILALLGIVPSITEDIVQNAFIAVVAILAQFGIVIDPTTKGVCDSDRALTYEKPSGGDEE
jgi:phi LC3 family holin